MIQRCSWLKGLAIAIGVLGGAPVMASDVIPPKSYTVTPGGMNLADGNFVYSVTDLSMGTLQLQRFYRGRGVQGNDPPFGKNFSHNFDIYIAVNPAVGGTYPYSPIVHIGQSASGTYYRTAAGVGTANMDAERGRLTWSGTQYVYMDSSGTTYTFSATIAATGMPFASFSRKIERIDFPDGRRQTFSYNASGYLKLVDDTSGYAMLFDYNADGDITTACALNRAQTYVSATSTCLGVGATLKTSYTYDGNKVLASATDVLNQVTTYTGGAASGLTCVKPPGFATCMVSINGYTQTLQDGGTWIISGQDPDVVNNPDADPVYDGSNEVAVTDPNGVLVYYYFTKSSPYTIWDANGNFTQFRYKGASPYSNLWPQATTTGTFLMEATYPEGNKYVADYQGPFKSITTETMIPKPGSGLNNLVKTYGYASTCTTPPASYQNCAKPLWIKDPNNNQTDYQYALHGGVTSVMRPAGAGGVRPLQLFTYVQKAAYIKNSGGSLVAAPTSIWVVSTSTECQSSSSTPVCDPSPAVQIVTTYQYGANGTANNLRVRGAAVASGGTTLRTCYGYDNQGNKISETSPRAGLGSCP
jgi:hypothetical protein